MRAIATAQDALLDLSEGDGIEENVDYPAEAIYALTDSLYLYENGQHILPDRILEADTAVRVMKLSPEGSRVLTVDASGQIVIWQPGDNNSQIVLDTAYSGVSSGMENEIAFCGEDKVFCPTKDGVTLYDLSGGSAKEGYSITCDRYAGIIVLQDKKQAIVLTEAVHRSGLTSGTAAGSMTRHAVRERTSIICFVPVTGTW